jgi:hypothetical protein
MTNGFQDEPHIDRIVEALWAREPVGSAALLVGAGFSRNATPVRAAAGEMPGWNSIYTTMVNQLYPTSGEAVTNTAEGELGPREWALQQSGATSAYLRIAEEFEAQFGRDALDKLILRHVPDRQFAPGKLHQMLVQLPWTDIMTTNWDTLLERAAESAEERVYDVVRTVEEIPEARSPRIIKLHGSFPSHRPFVFTEEDFRQYPAKSGAFVNLAQQLAMENTLVLLGFSGDDPNFLFWSGWVRDRLGPKAPFIYLVGVLNLTNPKRKMLETRRIQPVDLAQLPQIADWPAGQQKANAHQWFLERLRAGEPYPSRRWPQPAAAFLPPLQFLEARADPRAPIPEDEGYSNKPPLEKLRGFVVQWRQHREVYPGWIVPPLDTSESLWTHISHNLHDIAAGLKEMDEDERLEALYELNWRQEVALVPLVLTVDDLITALLDAMLDRYETLKQQQRNQFCALALALVRHAREENDPALFSRWANWLDSQLADSPDARDRLQYERCLQLRANLDIDGLDAALRGWVVESDSFWMLRKAALLADLGRDEEASDLSAQTLTAIREQTIPGTTDLASWSRESFAMLFRATVLQATIGQWRENQPLRDRFNLRQEQLEARGCPGRRDYFSLSERLDQVAPRLRQLIERTRQFDLGSTNRTHYFGGLDPRLDRLLAYQALRFQEQSGLPHRIGNVAVTSAMVAHSALWLMEVAPTRALDAMLRSAPGRQKDFDKLLPRPTVARMAVEEAERLIDLMIRLVAAGRLRIDNGGDEARYWIERLQVGLEIASRVILRAPSRAAMLAEIAIELHTLERFARNIDLGKQIWHVIQRSLEAASGTDRDAILLALFQRPFSSRVGGYADEVIDLAGRVSRDLELETVGPEWSVIVQDTIAALHQRETRLSASARISWLQSARLIDENAKPALGEALWAEDFREADLPTMTVFYPTAFLKFPRPADANPSAALHAMLRSNTPLAEKDLIDDTLAHVLQNQDLAFDEAIIVNQVERLNAFVGSHAPQPRRRNPFGDKQEDLIENCARMVASLALRGARQQCAFETLRTIAAGDSYPLRLEPALPALASLGLISADDAITRLRRLFESTDEIDSIALDVLYDQFRWDAPMPPEVEQAIWHEVAKLVVVRKPAALSTTLRFVAHMARRDPDRIPRTLDELLSLGLASILSETDMTSTSTTSEFDPFLVRFFAALLVTELNAAGRCDPVLSRAWAEAIENDPLPDTRRGREIAARPKSEDAHLASTCSVTT